MMKLNLKSWIWCTP